MQSIGGKWRYAIRAVGVIIFCVFGAHSCNVAMYSAWQTAFPQNTPYLNQLSIRFWCYGVFAVFAFGCAVVVLVTMIRRMNQENKSE